MSWAVASKRQQLQRKRQRNSDPSAMTPSPGDKNALLLSSLQVASQSWSAFDWNSRRSQWDQTVAQSKEQKEQSLTRRKQLAETTKQFKRSVKSSEQASSALAENSASQEHVTATVKSMDGLAKECRKTVKAYQEEIDNLTRRCKSSDTAFHALYQALTEVPDPASLLGTAMEQIHSQQSQLTQMLRTVDECNREMQTMETNYAQQSEVFQKEIAQLQEKNKKDNDGSSGHGFNKADREELIQLRREVAEYEVEFRGLKNQDITIRKLEAKINDLQKSGQEELQKELKKTQQDLAETEGRRAAEALEREAIMERKVQNLELQLKAERAGREATQAHLLEADEGAGEREAAWEAQRQIIVDDAARLRENLHEVTRERDALRLSVAAREEGGSPSHPPSAPSSGSLGMADMILERKAYEAEVSELSHTTNTLREELRMKEVELAEEKRNSMATIESLEHERARLSSSVNSLEAKLATAPSQASVDNMKRELRILKRLEYNADDVDGERDPEMTTGGARDDEEPDLETVLVGKLRRVESELVRERNQKSDYFKECEEIKQQLSSAEKAKEVAEKLVASLEADLQQAIATPVMTPMARKNSKSSLVAAASENPATLQRILDPDAPPLSGGVPVLTPVATSTAATEKANDDHSVATIVMAQRDRLRARCEALEAERDSFKRELQIQVQSAESLKADNTKLYEKVRYLQNFSSPSSRGGTSSRSSNKVADRDLDLEALEQRYEASVDPFRQFGRAERQRKMKEMSPVERAVFIVAKTVLGSKEMRTALFIYVVAMHLLVFITTYHWSHESGCHNFHDPEHLAHLPPHSVQVAAAAGKAALDVASSAGGG